jgi:release factor glutamine methyltransferase
MTPAERLSHNASAVRPTVSHLLAWARKRMEDSEVDAPWLTALVLLEHTTGVGREAVLAHPEVAPDPAGVAAFQALVERRCQREPTAYLLGYREFYGRRFVVTPATLIPRPETEGLISLTLERADRMADQAPSTLLDIGTGSGAIAVTLLTQRPQLFAIGVDRMVDALQVARLNAATHKVTARLRLVATHLVDGIRGQYSLIVANLPYVPTGTIDSLQPEVARYEPHRALDGGEDGLQLIGALLQAGDRTLAPRGSILAEIGDGQADQARNLARTHFPDCRVTVEDDATGSPRFLVVDRAL